MRFALKHEDLARLNRQLADIVHLDLSRARVVASGSRVVGNYHGYSDLDFYVVCPPDDLPVGARTAHVIEGIVCQYNYIHPAMLRELLDAFAAPLSLSPGNFASFDTLTTHPKIISRLATGTPIWGDPLVHAPFPQNVRRVKACQVATQIGRLLEDLAGAIFVEDPALIVGACIEINRCSLELALTLAGDLQYGEILTISRCHRYPETSDLYRRLNAWESELRHGSADNPQTAHVFATARTASYLTLQAAIVARDGGAEVACPRVPDFATPPNGCYTNPFMSALHYSDGRDALLLPDRGMRVNLPTFIALANAWRSDEPRMVPELLRRKLLSHQEEANAAWIGRE